MVPNQKKIAINKEACDTNNIYAKINIKALSEAMKDLTPSQFQVWLYFAKNQNDFIFELSSVAVCSFCNISDKTYREAIKTLVAKRYLIKRNGQNMYDFYEIPIEIEEVEDGALVKCHTTTEHV